MGTDQSQRLVRTGIIVVTLMLTALFCAQGATQLVANSLFPAGGDETASAAPARSRRTVPRGPREKSSRDLARAVLDRNLFDSETGSMTWDAPRDPTEIGESEEGGEDVDDPTGEPDFCDGNLRLVGAMVVPKLPHLSFASVEVGGKALLYRAGASIDGHELVGIREQRIFLRPSGKPLCQIAMFRPDAPPPSKTSRPRKDDDDDDDKKKKKPSRRKRKGALSDEELDQGITKNSDTAYTVSRSLVDKVLTNQAELMRSARIIPYEKEGRVIGVKVYGIRRNSLLGRLGMQNGDVLRTINGFDMTSPDSALEAYTRLRNADQLTISMLRRGEAKNLEYSIR